MVETRNRSKPKKSLNKYLDANLKSSDDFLPKNKVTHSSDANLKSSDDFLPKKKVTHSSDAKPQPKPTETKKILVPKIVNKENIKRKVANKPEFENIDMKIYKYTNANMTINDIRDTVTKITKKLTDAGLDIKVNTTINTPMGWRSGRITDGRAQIQVWSPTWGTNAVAEEDNINTWYDDGNGIVNNFEIFVQAYDREGGHDKHNDCVYNALYVLLKENLTDHYPSAWKLKQALKIARDDFVNADDHIDKIERWLNIGIFIEGDVNRTPKIKGKGTINLVLLDKHYTAKQPDKNHTPKYTQVERLPIYYFFDKETNIYHYYDGTKIKQDIKDIFKEKLLSKTQMTDKIFYMKCSKLNNLEKEHDEFILNADELKKITNGRINMYKTLTIKQTALKLFYDMTKHIDEPDIVDNNEANFILKCYRGGLTYHKKFVGEASKGDVCSMYPSIMTRQTMFPYKKGDFKILTQDELLSVKDKKGKQYFKYGIYRAKITPTGEKAFLFKNNINNHYTHIEMQLAHKLGFDIELIQDGTSNFLFYPTSSLCTGTNVFKHFVDYMFDLKSKYPHLKYIKKVLNILWGALCEAKISHEYYLKGNNEIILEANEEITSFKVFGEDHYLIICEEIGNKFVSGFSRISPFITAHGRDMIAKLAIEHVKDLNNIQRIYCDCILASEPLNLKDKAECDIGEFGLEHPMEKVEVVNIMKVKNL